MVQLKIRFSEQIDTPGLHLGLRSFFGLDIHYDFQGGAVAHPTVVALYIGNATVSTRQWPQKVALQLCICRNLELSHYASVCIQI